MTINQFLCCGFSAMTLLSVAPVEGFFVPTRTLHTNAKSTMGYTNNGLYYVESQVANKEESAAVVWPSIANDQDKKNENKKGSIQIKLNKKKSRSQQLLKSPVHTNDNVCPQTGVTLSRYMMELVRLNPELQDVQSIVTSLQVACKAISKLVRNASLQQLTGLQDGGGSMNVQGEEQKKLDVMANDVLKNALKWTGKMRTLVSEEDSAPVSMGNKVRDISDPNNNNKCLVDTGDSFIAVFDPLDGSSNVDAGIPVGTIFGIFEPSEDCQVKVHDQEESVAVCMEDVLQPGNNLVAAGYCLYSSATTLVLTVGNGVHGFTLDETLGEFVLTHPNMKIPKRGKVYSFNEGNRWEWDEATQKYITDIQQGRGETGSKYSARYVGSMVADIHRTLQYGGVFGYPSDAKNKDGKLRLLYEASPMSFLMEQAGGMAVAPQTTTDETTTIDRIMNIDPTNVHQRVPCIMGSSDDIKEFCSYYNLDKDAMSSIDMEDDTLFAANSGKQVRCENGVCWLQ